MKNSRLYYTLLTILLFLIPVAIATNYYVATDGNDANAGTIESPLRTPQLAVMQAQPGDTIYLRGGTYGLSHAYPTGSSCWTCTPDGSGTIYYDILFIGDRNGAFAPWVTTADSRAVNYFVESGTATNPITIKSYPGERAILDGYGIKVREERYWNIEDFTIRNATIGINAYYGGYTATTRTHDITIRGNDISNYFVVGGDNPGLIRIMDSPSTGSYGAYNIRIENNILHDFGSKTCINRAQTPGCNEDWTGDERNLLWSETQDAQHFGGVTIMSCEIYSSPVGNCAGTGRVDIINNTIYNTPTSFFIKNPMLGPVYIQNNTLYNAQYLGTWAGSNLLFERNLVYGIPSGANTGGLPTSYPNSFFRFSGQNYTIRQNTYIGTGPIAQFKVNASGHSIINNVVYGITGRTPGGMWGTPSYLLREEGGAFEQYDPAAPAQSQFGTGNTFDNNCFIVPYTDFLAIKRIVKNTPTGSPFVTFHNITDIQTLWGLDSNSKILIENNANNVFQNPTVNNYRLIGTAATQCAAMGVYAAQTPSTTPPPASVGICEASGNAKCYYIDPTNGNDANNGSFATPWNSFRNVISWYQPEYRPLGWKTLGPGDYIYLLNGTVNTTIIPGGWNGSCNCAQPDIGPRGIAYFRGVSGTQANPIHLKNYPGNNPAIGDTMNEPYNFALDFMTSSWWEVSGIEFKNVSGDCIDLTDNANDIKIWNVSVHDCARKETDGNPAGLKLSGVYRSEVFNSTFYDTFWDPRLATPDGQGTWFLRGAGIQLFVGGNHTIHNNIFLQTKQGYDVNSNPAGYAGCIFQKHAQTDVNGFFHIYNNTFRNCGEGAFGSGTQNTWFHHNIISDSRYGISIMDFGGITYQANQLYEYNTIINTQALRMVPSTAPYNNLFPILPINITLRNNIIVDDLAGYSSDANFIDIDSYMDDTKYDATIAALTLSNNCYYNPVPLQFNIGRANGGSYGIKGGLYSFAQWQGIGFDTTSVNANPLFVNAAAGDFRLQAGSPCSTMGVYGTSSVTTPPSTRRTGDLNGDGVVNINDVILIIANFKRRGNYDEGADINNDGIVNIFDMVLLGRNWG